VRRGIIKAGGDMTVFGGKRGGAWEESRGGASGSKDAKPFKVGIQHPRAKDKLLGTVTVFEGAVTTSGDYERFFIMGNDDNIRYHHILDPKTGFPVKGLMSVTIISKEAALADALSTAVFVMGPLKGMVFVESLPGVEAVIVDSLGVITLSSGAAGIFEEL
jgi:thiamine biosynthesis lipoprotein